MGDQQGDSGASPEILELSEMRRSNSEAFSIIGTELAEMKSMLMVILDLQKSTILASGMTEEEVEGHVQTLLNGYRERFLAVMTDRIQRAAGREGNR